jgi:hypothetical protein
VRNTNNELTANRNSFFEEAGSENRLNKTNHRHKNLLPRDFFFGGNNALLRDGEGSGQSQGDAHGM